MEERQYLPSKTSEIKSDEIKVTLSEEQAQAVADYLRELIKKIPQGEEINIGSLHKAIKEIESLKKAEGETRLFEKVLQPFFESLLPVFDQQCEISGYKTDYDTIKTYFVDGIFGALEKTEAWNKFLSEITADPEEFKKTETYKRITGHFLWALHLNQTKQKQKDIHLQSYYIPLVYAFNNHYLGKDALNEQTTRKFATNLESFYGTLATNGFFVVEKNKTFTMNKSVGGKDYTFTMSSIDEIHKFLNETRKFLEGTVEYQINPEGCHLLLSQKFEQLLADTNNTKAFSKLVEKETGKKIADAGVRLDSESETQIKFQIGLAIQDLTYQDSLEATKTTPELKIRLSQFKDSLIPTLRQSGSTGNRGRSVNVTEQPGHKPLEEGVPAREEGKEAPKNTQ